MKRRGVTELSMVLNPVYSSACGTGTMSADVLKRVMLPFKSKLNSDDLILLSILFLLLIQ